MDTVDSDTGAPAVRVLATSRVAPAKDAAGSHVKVKLSFLDVQFIARPPISLVCLYDLAGGGDGDAFPSVVRRLKESLTATLPHCLPIAGKLVYAEDTGDVVVDCSDPGVAFFEAEFVAGGRSGGVDDVRRLASYDEAHDAPNELFARLTPEFEGRVLPAPVLAVQATRLGAGGGMALAVSVHHAVIDGRAFWLSFLEMWNAAYRESAGHRHVYKPIAETFYGREAISAAHPRGDDLARELLRKLAPNLPVASRTDYYFGPRPGLAWRKLCHSAHDIRSLQWSIDRLSASEAGGGRALPTQRTSRFLAISALYWTAFVRSSKELAPEDTVYLAFPADLRERLLCPTVAYYIGSCVKKCLARASAGELLGGSGLLRALQAIQATLREVAVAPLAGTEVQWAERVAHVPPGRLAAVAGWPLLPLYKTADFGFGRPTLVDHMPLDCDGRMTITGGRWDGEVQVSVSLDRTRMDAFVAHVLSVGIRARF
ncbi:unnamed protein product [Urochloa humidicola]